MNSSNDLYQDLMECVQHASEGVVSSFNDNKELSDSVRSTSQDFMKLFQANLTVAINTMYFGENDSEKNPDVLDSEPKKDNNIEYEKVIMDIISKRRQGTKVCKDVLEKTLHLERKTVMALEVAPGTINVQKFEKPQGLFKKEELKFGAKKTSEHLKTTTFKVIEIKERTDELIKAAVIFKETNHLDDFEVSIDT